VVLFNPDPTDKIKVSPAVTAMGLNVIKAAPNEVTAFSLPDVRQTRYGDYLFNLCVFIYSYVYSKVVKSFNGPMPILYEDVKEDILLPFQPIPIVLAWPTEPAAETMQKLRDSLIIEETVSGGKTAVLFRPTKLAHYEKVKGYNANIRATTVNGQINIKAMLMFRDVLAILSSLLAIHKYPAFTDHEHLYNIVDSKVMTEVVDEDVDMTGTDTYTHAPTAPYGDDDAVLKGGKHIRVDMSKDFTLAAIPSFITDINHVPNADGLWFPYFTVLTNYDIKTVPDFFEKMLLLTLDEDLEGCIKSMRELRGEWGVIGMTETGKQISHMVKVLSLALYAQARAVPVFLSGTYMGTIMSGGCYTINVHNKAYRPVSFNHLLTAIRNTNMHGLAIEKLASLMGNEGQRDEVRKANSMVELYRVLRSSWTMEKNKAVLMENAAFLRYPGYEHWAINVQTISNALGMIRDPNFSLLTCPSTLPIHYTQLLTQEVMPVVWSCFGPMAPTFRIPGGTSFDLNKDMKFDVKQKDGSLRPQQLTRISVRNVILDKAIADLKITLESKTILNPLSAPKVRASAMNQDRAFTGDSGKSLLQSLRDFCGVTLAGGSGSGKRIRDDTEEPAERKGKRLRLEGW
jgi:hypothetical protein